MKSIQRRLKKFKSLLRKEKSEAFLVSNESNVRYLSGFTGDSSMLLITSAPTTDRASKGDQGDYIITDFRYVEQIEKEAPHFEIVKRKNSIIEAISNFTSKLGVTRLGFESASFSFGQHKELSEKSPKLDLIPATDLVEQLRRIKDGSEIKQIRNAIRIAEDAFDATKGHVKPGVTEVDLGIELEFQMKRRGAQKSAFDIIVAAGKRCSLPHARATNRAVQPGEQVLFDWGASANFYNSDLTRVVFLDRISRRSKAMYNIVLEAQSRAVNEIRPGLKACEVDKAAREYIKSRRHGKHFGHGLGHGVGLDIHETPRIGEKDETELKPGMVFTVEPGIYIPGWGGIRIEDMVLVTKQGCEVLTSVAKKLEENCVCSL